MKKNKTKWTFNREEELSIIKGQLKREFKTNKTIILELGGYDSSKNKTFTLEKVGEDNIKIYFKKVGLKEIEITNKRYG